MTAMTGFRVQGEVVLVTGASRGIGRACLLALAQSGATVIGTATTAEGASRITTDLAAEGLSGRGLVLDVTCEASVAEALADRTPP